MPMGLNAQELDRIEEVVAVRRKIKRGTALFSNGDVAEQGDKVALIAARLGKTRLIDNLEF